MADKRNKQVRRRFIIEIDDKVNIPFDGRDVEDIGDKFQAILNENFDCEVREVVVEKFSDYKNEWVIEESPS